MCVELLTPGLILPPLVYWYWSSLSAASECDQLEAKRMGQIKQTCCFGFCRLSAWYSDAGVSVMLIPASGVHSKCTCTLMSVHLLFVLCQWSQLLMKWLRANEAFSFFFIRLCLAVKLVVFLNCHNETYKVQKVRCVNVTWSLPRFDLCSQVNTHCRLLSCSRNTWLLQ